VAADNPLLASMLALHKESCRLLYTSGASTHQERRQSASQHAKSALQLA
jgi:hypothetical protein